MNQQLITDSNYGPLIEVFVWLLLALTVVAVAGREAVKLWVLRKIANDDAIILLSLLFSIAQSVVVLYEVHNGLGQHESDLSDSEMDRQQKARYAAEILLIPSLFLAKAALLCMIHSLSPKRSHQWMSWGIGTLLVLWAVISICLSAFRCSLPHPWNDNGNICIDRDVVMDFIALFNLVTEIALVILPCLIVQGLQVTLRKKLPVYFTFLSRLVVVVVIICQITFSSRVNEDASFELWKTVICTQIVQCVTIATTCFVYLRPFLDSMDSGFIRVDDARRRGQAIPKYNNASSQGKSHDSSDSRTTAGSGTQSTRDIPEEHELREVHFGPVREDTDLYWRARREEWKYDERPKMRPREEWKHDERSIMRTREYMVRYH